MLIFAAYTDNRQRSFANDALSPNDRTPYRPAPPNNTHKTIKALPDVSSTGP